MNHRLPRHASLAALLFGAAALLSPGAHAVKKNKSTKLRNKPLAGRQGTPLANALRDMPTDLRIDSKAGFGRLTELAGKYAKVPALGRLDPERRIKGLFQQIAGNSRRAAGILEKYAQTLHGLAEYSDLTIVSTTHGEDVKVGAIIGEYGERPGLKTASEHLGVEARRERQRADKATKDGASFGCLDTDVPLLNKSTRRLKKEVSALDVSGTIDINRAIELVSDADELIADGDHLLNRVRDQVSLRNDDVDHDAASAAHTDSKLAPDDGAETGVIPDQGEYGSLFERVLQIRRVRVERILQDVRVWRRQICQWAGLPHGQFVLLGDLLPAEGLPSPNLDEQIESMQREHLKKPKEHNRGRFRKQGPGLFARRLVNDALKRVEAADEEAASIMRQRALERPYRDRATQLGLAGEELGYGPNKSPVYRINIDGYSEAHELLAERAMMLLNSWSNGRAQQENLWWGFSISNASTETKRGGFFSKAVRVWDGKRLLIDQVSARRENFWRRFFVDPPVGRKKRALAEPVYRAVVELLVEKHFRTKLEPEQRDRIGSEYRLWVHKPGIPLVQILGLTETTPDQSADVAARLDREGPRFAKETDLVLQELLRTPPPAFEPFVPHLEGRQPHIAWNAQTLDITLEYTQP